MKHIVSYSGGKDSTAMLLRMIELNMQIDKIVFADTGLEYPEIYTWIAKIEKHINREITVVKSKHSFDYYFYRKVTKGKMKGQTRGLPYVITPCWAQRDLKVNVMRRIQKKDDYVYLGIAKCEEHRIQIDKTEKAILKYPLIEWGWTEKNCIEYLKSLGLKHPLSDRFKRTGCWLCPKQSKNSLRSLYLYYPELWQKLKKYEKDSPHRFAPDKTLKDYENIFEAEKNQVRIF